MNRRDFFRAMPAPLAAGALLVTGNAGAKPGFVAQPIVKRIKMLIDCDLTDISAKYAISIISSVTGMIPLYCRATCGPWVYPEAKELSVWLETNAHIMVEVRCDVYQRNVDAWYIEGNGVVVWSLGA